MSPIRLASFRLDERILQGMKALHERDGVSQSEQVRRALKAWLDDRGISIDTPQKAARKRASTRKRA